MKLKLISIRTTGYGITKVNCLNEDTKEVVEYTLQFRQWKDAQGNIVVNEEVLRLLNAIYQKPRFRSKGYFS